MLLSSSLRLPLFCYWCRACSNVVAGSLCYLLLRCVGRIVPTMVLPWHYITRCLLALLLPKYSADFGVSARHQPSTCLFLCLFLYNIFFIFSDHKTTTAATTTITTTNSQVSTDSGSLVWWEVSGSATPTKYQFFSVQKIIFFRPQDNNSSNNNNNSNKFASSYRQQFSSLVGSEWQRGT